MSSDSAPATSTAPKARFLVRYYQVKDDPRAREDGSWPPGDGQRRHTWFHIEQSARDFYIRLTFSESIAYCELIRVDGVRTEQLAYHFAEDGGAL